MTDLENTLGPRLHRLADELSPDADPLDQASSARSRYRRQRRTRFALAGLATATAAIVIAVPATIGSVSSSPQPGDAAAPHAGRPSAPPTTAEESQAAEAAAEARLAAAAEARAGRTETLDERLDDDDWTALVPLLRPLPLTAPAGLTSCPDAAATLSTNLGIPLQQWPDESPGDPSGCLWGVGDPTAPPDPADRYSVSIGFLPAGVRADTDGDCSVLDAPQVAAGSQLRVCDATDGMRWRLDVPDTSGAGVWVFGATVGDRAAGPSGAAALVAVSGVAPSTG